MRIKKILIANRGEIALRIIRTCQEMGIKTVALCPSVKEKHNFLETRLADECYFLEKQGSEGYLDQKRIIKIAKKSKADAIHPGYGFLAENWKFARRCHRNNIKFIGPHFKVLKKLEDKIEAKKIARKIGIPILEASDRPIKSKKDLIKWVQKIKMPFVLKAQKGGGGIGIRVINGHKISFGEIFAISLGLQRQMGLAFSDVDFFLEKYLPEARHIEFQILGDGEKSLSLGERECSIQRRFQKLLEESPSPFLDEKLREKLSLLSVKFAQELKYQGAGTIEFLVDKDKNFYFMEVNPRIQVEHPITEAVTGIDIVEQQIRIAQGEKISFSQDDISFNGWAIEARINAEDPQKDFQPVPGIIQKYVPPGGQGIFLHTFLQPEQEIYPYFDSLLAKVISWGKTRDEAIRRLSRALDEIIIEGVPTTLPFFKVLLKNKDFQQGNFATDFIEKKKILKDIVVQVPAEEEKPSPAVSGTVVGQEKELAEIAFQVYQALKKTTPTFFEKDEGSNWLMTERLKMLE